MEPPDDDTEVCRRELARRYFHAFGPSTPSEFAMWAGIDRRDAYDTFERLGPEVVEVRTERSARWMLAESLTLLSASVDIPAATRMLPPGDAFLLTRDRVLVLADSIHRTRLWPQGNVPPGGVLVEGELVGTWRRQGHAFTVSIWRAIDASAKEAVEAEIASMPPLEVSQPRVTWTAA